MSFGLGVFDVALDTVYYRVTLTGVKAHGLGIFDVALNTAYMLVRLTCLKFLDDLKACRKTNVQHRNTYREKYRLQMQPRGGLARTETEPRIPLAAVRRATLGSGDVSGGTWGWCVGASVRGGVTIRRNYARR